MVNNPSPFLPASQKFSLSVPGGGRRGIYSAATLTALHACGLLKNVGTIYASSVGALNAIYAILGQPQLAGVIYPWFTANTRSVNLRNFFLGKPVIDLDYIIDDVIFNQIGFCFSAFQKSRIELEILCSTSGKNPHWIRKKDLKTLEDLRYALHATCYIPGLMKSTHIRANHGPYDGCLAKIYPFPDIWPEKEHIILCGNEKNPSLTFSFSERLYYAITSKETAQKITAAKHRTRTDLETYASEISFLMAPDSRISSISIHAEKHRKVLIETYLHMCRQLCGKTHSLPEIWENPDKARHFFKEKTSS